MPKAVVKSTTKRADTSHRKPAATITEMVREYRACDRAGLKLSDNHDDRQASVMSDRCTELQDIVLATPSISPGDLTVKRRFVEKDVRRNSIDLNDKSSDLLEIILRLDAAHMARSR